MRSPTKLVHVIAIALALVGCDHRRTVRRPPAPPPKTLTLDEESPPPPVRPPPPTRVVLPPPPLPPPTPDPPPDPQPAGEDLAQCGRGPGERFVVQGVDASDTLNVRTRPDSRADVIGQLPSDATGILGMEEEQQVGSSVWRKIKCRNLVGWVNARFLVRQTEKAVARPEPAREPVREPPRW
jgi:hypothetical protein